MAVKKKVTIKLQKPRRATTLIVDADVVMYQVCTEALVEERNKDDEYTYTLNMALVHQSFDLRVLNLKRETGCSEVLVVFGSRENWRKKLSPEYKANRAKRKPLGYGDAVLWAMRNFKSEQRPRLEADDVIGMLASGGLLNHSVIASNDKDLMTVPGLHYDFGAPVPKVIEVTPEQALTSHYVLALAGDTSDGYKGCAGCGVKGAMEVLAGKFNEREMFKAALARFEKSGHSEQYAITQFQLSYVMRHDDYDYASSKVRLWAPPGKERASWL